MSKINAYYESSISEFLNDKNNNILGEITSNIKSAETTIQQKNTWVQQIIILKKELEDLKGQIIFEYTIPRMGKRVDNIVIFNNIIFVLEFKCGATKYISTDYDQVYDYALDLKNFHKESRDKLIVPILVATNAPSYNNSFIINNNVMQPLKCNADGIRDLIVKVGKDHNRNSFNYNEWINSEYLPTPTIVEAAQALYTGHNVKDITRNDAGAKNLACTTNAIEKIIEKSKIDNKKSICFVTGVPGAGKTLVGLNLAIKKSNAKNGEHAVFLSGNFPLVEVLKEALVRDKIKSLKEKNINVKKLDEKRKTDAFIQIIHKYRDSFIQNENIPPEHIVIFDEAQISWNQDKIASFMKTKKGIPNFNFSEPEFLISTMDRHKDWAVIVCLVGGGQEINSGEGGLPEWFNALNSSFKEWDIYTSTNLKDEYLMDKEWSYLTKDLNIYENDDLNLNVSIRSFRTPELSDLIKAILDIDYKKATYLYNKIKDNYPLVITRNIQTAKHWVKSKAKGSERYGLLASSGALRLKPDGIFVKNEINVANWFLNDKRDVRSCYALEDVVTEFDIQGLEVDYTLVAWDADLRFANDKWEYKSFKGSKWNSINKFENKLYLKNTYRVLLTRARQGMIIYVPKGNDNDITRLSEFYDGTYNFLKSIGITEI